MSYQELTELQGLLFECYSFHCADCAYESNDLESVLDHIAYDHIGEDDDASQR